MEESLHLSSINTISCLSYNSFKNSVFTFIFEGCLYKHCSDLTLGIWLFFFCFLWSSYLSFPHFPCTYHDSPADSASYLESSHSELSVQQLHLETPLAEPPSDLQSELLASVPLSTAVTVSPLDVTQNVLQLVPTLFCVRSSSGFAPLLWWTTPCWCIFLLRKDGWEIKKKKKILTPYWAFKFNR